MLGGAVAAGLLLPACGESEAEVTANEDLMREHGVIRRALLVYAETAQRARRDPASIPLPRLADTAKLFREFGEDYHERQLEEAHIFPQVRKSGGAIAQLADVLQSQHDRGREITDYILRISAQPSLAGDEALRLAATLEAWVLMYQHHAAREDTVLFPAWKKSLGPHAYEEAGERFEKIERKIFGHDGFDEGVQRITTIEAAFGLSDLARFTPPAPPPSPAAGKT